MGVDSTFQKKEKKEKRKKKKLYANIDLVLHTGFENSVDDSVVDIKCSNLADVTAEKSFDGSQDNESSECFKCPLEKVILSFLWCSVSIKTFKTLANIDQMLLLYT